jgi:hypothetical protein
MVSTRSQTSTPIKANGGTTAATGADTGNGSPGKKRKAEADSNGDLPMSSSKRPRDQQTDRARWRLKDERGRQTWHYLESDEEGKEWEQSVADRYLLGMETVSAAVHL